MELYPIGLLQLRSTALAIVLRARAKGKPINKTGGGRNKELAKDKEATLKLYCKRCILASEPLKRKHI